MALAFVLAMASFNRYAVAPLFPYFAFPVLAAAWARLPFGFLARKVMLVVPVAVLIALPNPFFEREIVFRVGDIEISGGWVSLVSILLRAMLATAAAVTLVAVTGFPAICGAMERLGMPKVLALQLLFLYRYLTVLGEEAVRVSSARELRAAGQRLSLRLYGALVGRLLVRTWDRAERIHMAMCARGFVGEFNVGRRTSFGIREWILVIACCAAFALLRFVDVSNVVGSALLGARP